MPELKIVINAKGKSYAKTLSTEESSNLIGKKISEKIEGGHLSFKGYEFEITGGSDKEGFPMRRDVDIARRKIFLTKGSIGTRINKKGLRIRRSIAGNTVSQLTSQVNLKVIKQGSKPLDEIFGKTLKEETKTEEIKAEENKG